jgi:hypothetical protein
LGAFVLRTTGVEALQWIDSVQAAAVIRALLGWQKRIGLRRADAAHMRSEAGNSEAGTARVLGCHERTVRRERARMRKDPGPLLGLMGCG